MTNLKSVQLEQPRAQSAQPTLTTRAFGSSGEANRRMHGEIAIEVPVRLIHGQADTDVPFEIALRLAKRLRSADVQTWMIKDGEHRLPRDPDIALMLRAVEDVIAACCFLFSSPPPRCRPFPARRSRPPPAHLAAPTQRRRAQIRVRVSQI